MDALANMANEARASHVRMDLVGKGMRDEQKIYYVSFIHHQENLTISQSHTLKTKFLQKYI